ncbi:hypothetical protein Sa4125_13220 [Aureimonas sp. SA4125]|nr:hypothetical protein Sa4125_13220 [Aureimonas sp. SA4125]
MSAAAATLASVRASVDDPALFTDPIEITDIFSSPGHKNSFVGRRGGGGLRAISHPLRMSAGSLVPSLRPDDRFWMPPMPDAIRAWYRQTMEAEHGTRLAAGAKNSGKVLHRNEKSPAIGLPGLAS